MIIKAITSFDGEVTCLTLRHLPFGFRAAALQAELRRRQRVHRRSLTARRKHLEALRAAAADLDQYISLLRDAADELQARQEELLRRLASPGTPGETDLPGPVPGPDTPDAPEAEIARLQARLHQYRALQEQICSGVMALIAPFLTPDPARYAAPERKGENLWPSGRHAKSTE
jgi:multidrug efflux pump subunit AcrA (membrane-fusion protein)